MSSQLTEEELPRHLTPIPTQIVSSDEFYRGPDNDRQRELEARPIAMAGELGGNQGLDRRRFSKTAVGMAGSFVAVSEVHGSLFDVSKAEAATVVSCPANCFLENFALRVDNPALITTVASFPANYFLENLALRADNSALVTAMNQKELWYAPPAAATETVTPILLHTFEQLTWSFNEVEPDVFYLVTSNVYTNHESSLYRIDLRKWSPGEAIQPQKVLDFPKEARWLNGSCLIGPRTILVADSAAALIWRVDLPKEGGTPLARVWSSLAPAATPPGTAWSAWRPVATG